ncbi:MAG: glycosyltransferase family 2 protein, partial [Xanthomonadales bacterium]|nr:glycosyltransferase family 2 protein [Xanthomonadales bacterium]
GGPVHNEADNLAEVTSRLAQTSNRCAATIAVVVVDDGSTDASLACAVSEVVRLPGSRVVELSRNFGKEAALLAGMDTAMSMDFDALVLMDADLQHPPEAIPEMLSKWRAGSDVVIAARKSRASDSLTRRLLSRAFYRIINRLGDVSIVDGDGDFRLLTRDAVQALCSLREQDRFTKGLYSWIGFRQERIFVDFDSRSSGESRFNMTELMGLAGSAITSFSSKPLRISLYVGTITGIIAALLGIEIVIQTLIFGKQQAGYASIFCGMMFLGGIQLVTIGLLGEYVGKTYIQSKDRPPYITRSVVRVDDQEGTL